MIKKYTLWALWKLLRVPSHTWTFSVAFFLPWLSPLTVNNEEVLIVGQPNMFTIEVIPYSFKQLLTMRVRGSV